MKLAIDTHGNKLVLDVTEKTGALIEALTQAQLYSQEYKHGKYVYVPAGTEESPITISIELLNDGDLVAPTPMIDDLTASLKRTEKRWLDEYANRTAAEKKLVELQKKIDALTEADVPVGGVA